MLPRTPWWTPELIDLLQQVRQQQAPDYLLLRRAMSRATASYWKERRLLNTFYFVILIPSYVLAYPSPSLLLRLVRTQRGT